MMRGTHARDDNSFSRSASTQTLKGAGLILLALILGVALLHTAPHANTLITGGGPSPTVRPTTPPASTPDTSTTNPQARPASQVRVLVANGAGVANLGARIRSQLNAAGYNTDKPAIDAPTQNNATSSIYYAPGFEPDAVQLAGVLSLPQTAVQQLSPASPPVPATNLINVDIVVIAGQDIGTPSTTAAPGATVAPGSNNTTAPTSPPTTVHHVSPTTTHAPTPTTHAPTPTSPPTTSPSHTTTTVNLK